MIFVFYFFRSIIPIYPFILPYLTKNKNIKIRDFHKCLRISFIGNLIFIILGQIYICFFSSKSLLIIETICELSFYLILFCMKKGSVTMLCIGALAHSASQSFAMVTKDLLYISQNSGSGSSETLVYATYNFCKKFGGILSSFLGQDLLFYTGHFGPLLIFSLISCFITLICSFFVQNTGKIRKQTPVRDDIAEIVEYLFHYRNKNIDKGDIGPNYRSLFYMLSYTIGSLIYICFSFYSSNIFIENREEITRLTVRFSNLLKCLLKPIRILSIVYNFILSFFICYKKEKQSIVLHGYVDGLARLTALFFSHLLIQFINFSPLVTLFFIFNSILFTFLMASASSLFFLYLIYILNISMANLIIVASAHHFRYAPNTGLVFGAIGLFCAIVHVVVSYLGNKESNYDDITQEETDGKILNVTQRQKRTNLQEPREKTKNSTHIENKIDHVDEEHSSCCLGSIYESSKVNENYKPRNIKENHEISRVKGMSLPSSAKESHESSNVKESHEQNGVKENYQPSSVKRNYEPSSAKNNYEQNGVKEKYEPSRGKKNHEPFGSKENHVSSHSKENDETRRGQFHELNSPFDDDRSNHTNDVGRTHILNNTMQSTERIDILSNESKKEDFGNTNCLQGLRNTYTSAPSSNSDDAPHKKRKDKDTQKKCVITNEEILERLPHFRRDDKEVDIINERYFDTNHKLSEQYRFGQIIQEQKYLISIEDSEGHIEKNIEEPELKESSLNREIDISSNIIKNQDEFSVSKPVSDKNENENTGIIFNTNRNFNEKLDEKSKVSEDQKKPTKNRTICQLRFIYYSRFYCFLYIILVLIYICSRYEINGKIDRNDLR